MDLMQFGPGSTGKRVWKREREARLAAGGHGPGSRHAHHPCQRLTQHETEQTEDRDRIPISRVDRT